MPCIIYATSFLSPLDGLIAARDAQDNYHKSFKTPAKTTINNTITIGGSTGGGGGGGGGGGM